MNDEPMAWTPDVKLGDLVRVEHGWPFKSEFMDPTAPRGPIVVAIGNFRYDGGFRFAETTVKRYTGTYPEQYELGPDDLLVVMTCQTPDGEILGIPGKVPNDGETYLHNQRIGRVVPIDPGKASVDYLYYVLLWDECNRELYTTSTGTKILHTAPSRIEAFEFNLPPLLEQEAIASVLGALDDKIELNREMNKTLESIAQALYKSWFVDFDPVEAKAAGRKPYGMDMETADLFPDRFVDSELGPIPEGWSPTALSELAEFVNGRNFTKRASGDGRMVIRIAELNRGPGGSTIYNDVKAESKNIALPGDILFAWSGSLDVYRWHMGEALINQHIFKVIPKQLPLWFVHVALDESIDFFRAIAEGKATTMGHIKREHLSEAFAVVPRDAVIEAASETVQPLCDLWLSNHQESQTLAQLRDLLLSTLLSGKIRIRDAESLVREAL